MSDLAQLRAELTELRASREYAWANAHGCSMGAMDPRLDWVHQRERDLVGRIGAARAFRCGLFRITSALRHTVAALCREKPHQPR